MNTRWQMLRFTVASVLAIAVVIAFGRVTSCWHPSVLLFVVGGPSWMVLATVCGVE